MIIVGIDVGYHNLGVGCTIPHTNEVADLVAHFVEAYRDILYPCLRAFMKQVPNTIHINSDYHFFFLKKKVFK